MCEALTYLLDNIFIRFGTKLYRQTIGIPMGTNCASLIADLFLFCYERDFLAFLSYNKEAEIIQAFTSRRYFKNPYFEGLVGSIYPSELQLNKANAYHFWIYVYLFQTGSFHPKFIISTTTLILT